MTDTILSKEDSGYEGVHLVERGTFILFGSLIVLIIISALFGGLKVLNARQQQAVGDLKDQITQKENKLHPELLQEILVMDKRLRNMKSLLFEHAFSSNIFRIVERDTLSKVSFLNFSLAVEGKKIDMSARTTDFTTLAQQINIFERDPEIEQVSFGGLGLGNDESIQFRLSLVLKPSVLQFTPEFPH